MKKAMILAAGRGERLKPITDQLPKALCKINDIPIIEYHLRNLAQAGFEHVIINHAHLGQKIRDYVNSLQHIAMQISFSPEPPGGLETGGGIYQALIHFQDEPFLVLNADIFCEYDLGKIHLPANSFGHLVLVPNPKDKNGDFGLRENNIIDNDKRDYTFSGIACYQREFFANSKPGRYSVTPILRSHAAMGKISGELYQGKWADIGTIEKLSAVNASRASRR